MSKFPHTVLVIASKYSRPILVKESVGEITSGDFTDQRGFIHLTQYVDDRPSILNERYVSNMSGVTEEEAPAVALALENGTWAP